MRAEIEKAFESEQGFVDFMGRLEPYQRQAIRESISVFGAIAQHQPGSEAAQAFMDDATSTAKAGGGVTDIMVFVTQARNAITTAGGKLLI